MMRNATAWRSNGVQATCFLAVSHSESPPSSSFVVRSSLASDQLSILGLTASASKSDVKHAYKRLALKYHPDVIERQNKRPERFKEIKAAYESLMIKFDDEKEEYVIEAGEKGYYADEYDEWEEWMGFEGGMPVVYNPC